MAQPTISVIVPVYGVELYIEACLHSIAAQTFRDFELILVDDGCLDNSIPLAEQYLRTTDLNWHILHQENAGQGPARDHGIREAAGRYVICIDSDDTVSPVFLESLYGAAWSYDAEVSFSLFQMVDTEGMFRFSDAEPVFQTISRQEMLHRFLCRTLIPILPSMLIRRDLLVENKLTAAQGCRFSEDLYLMWLVFSSAQRVVYTPAPLYNYLHRENSTMTASTPERIMTGYAAFCALMEDKRFQPNFLDAECLLPRWVLGVLNSSARICDYPVFTQIAEAMDYQVQMKHLRRFPERKARILAGLLRLSPKLYYFILHR